MRVTLSEQGAEALGFIEPLWARAMRARDADLAKLVDRVIAVVARDSGVTAYSIRDTTTAQPVARARWVTMWIVRRHGIPAVRIAEAFNQTARTVQANVAKVSARARQDGAFRVHVEGLARAAGVTS